MSTDPADVQIVARALCAGSRKREKSCLCDLTGATCCAEDMFGAMSRQVVEALRQAGRLTEESDQ